MPSEVTMDDGAVGGDDDHTSAADATGAGSMSVDEFRQEMFRSLRDSGTVELIRAQLRRRFIEKLRQSNRGVRLQRGLSGNQSDGESALVPVGVHDGRSDRGWSLDEKVVHGLVVEYMERQGLEHTVSVFIPEIGGPKSHLEHDAVVEVLRLNDLVKTMTMPRDSKQPLILIALQELLRRLQVQQMDSGTQTVFDGADHRMMMENELRRVETTFQRDTELERSEPVKSIEERMLRFQQECEAMATKRLGEELERFKTTELEWMRVEERKKFEHAAIQLREALLLEAHTRQERFQDREHELEAAFVTKRTELETSLFELRQELLLEMEKVRAKESQLQAKAQDDFRMFTAETKRLQTLEDNMRTREANLDQAMQQTIREREKAWGLERQQLLFDISAREEALQAREVTMVKDIEAMTQQKADMRELRTKLADAESAIERLQLVIDGLHRDVARLESDKKALQDDRLAHEELSKEDKSSVKALSSENARLSNEVKMLQAELAKAQQRVDMRDMDTRHLEVELRQVQQDLLTLKMNEANAVVEERKKAMLALEAERESFQWRENELVKKIRDLQRQLAEAEASSEKYQIQFEDEKVHVESLRHEVTSLNNLLAQAHSAIHAKHGPPSPRGISRGWRHSQDTKDFHGAVPQGLGSDQALAQIIGMLGQLSHIGGGVVPTQSSVLPTSPAPASVVLQPSPETTEELRRKQAEEKEAAALAAEQRRMEHELLEAREYERKKNERLAQEEKELVARRLAFDEELQRQRKLKEDEDAQREAERTRRMEEEQAKARELLEKQQQELQQALESQRKLQEETIAKQNQLEEEQRRLEQERRLEAQRQEAEAEAERLRLKKKQEDEEEQQKAEQVRLEEAEKERQRQEALRIERERELEEQRWKEEALEEQRQAIVRQNRVAQEQQVEKEAKSEQSEAASIDALQDPASLASIEASEDSQQPPTGRVVETHAGGSEDTSDKEQQLKPSTEQKTGGDGAVESESMDAPPPEPAPVIDEATRKKQEDEATIDAFRQRVLARRSAEKQKQEQEEQRRREEEEATAKAATERERQASESENELELSGGSFAESSAGSNSDSF